MKKTYHLQAFKNGEEIAFMCTSDKEVVLHVTSSLILVPGVTSVTFDEVINCECN